MGQFLSKFPVCVTTAVLGGSICQYMKACSVVDGLNLFPTTNIMHTVRWLTVDTSTTTSPAQSCSAGAS